MDRSLPAAALKYLVLDENDLSRIDDDSGIVRCTSLHLLSLRRNRLAAISPAVGQLTELRSLLLSDNPIARIPDELGRLARLLHLCLSSTNLRTVPLVVAGLPSLRTLALDDCTELDRQLAGAYRTSGRTGVVDYLRQQQAEDVETQSGGLYVNGVDLRPNSSKQRVRTVATASILPADPPTVVSPQPTTAASPNARPVKSKKPVLQH